MRLATLSASLSAVTLQGAMWLFPVVFALHVREEWPCFPTWAQRYASAAFTRRQYVAIHLTGLIAAVLVPILWRLFPRPAVAFPLFAFVLIPSMGWNAVFHAGATVVSRTYCPGLITALTLPPAPVCPELPRHSGGGTIAGRVAWGVRCRRRIPCGRGRA